ncbi:hypothetical protein [Lysinibacillus sp. Bpr_S20]|uniref:hypothetical protein n=1 Tax=Lysinibacillus sp. Bpr_S20 TaxID=2933964 RepID=UPI00201198CD|nr:hypothetical protein [Lysinibacillus sp. Bpr_S20]MCL1703305.1 hypothetical protein [Lysinibacillus sp. Bpr_S20]
MFFARKRSVNAAAAESFVCAKAQRQQQYDVGHEGVITGRDGFSLRSSIADPRGVAQPTLQSTYYTTHIPSPTKCSISMGKQAEKICHVEYFLYFWSS